MSKKTETTVESKAEKAKDVKIAKEKAKKNASERAHASAFAAFAAAPAPPSAINVTIVAPAQVPAAATATTVATDSFVAAAAATADSAARSAAATSAAAIAGSLTTQTERIFSRESNILAHDTLFNEFSLIATPVYNFWVQDEIENDRESLGNRRLSDVPRFIKLSWKTAPRFDDGIFPETAQKEKSKNYADPLGLNLQSARSQFINGIAFAPEHLQRDSFQMIKKSLVGDVISPGVMESIVEKSGILANISHGDTIIDEDSFLRDESSGGLSMSEVIANAKNIDEIGSSTSLKFSKKGVVASSFAKSSQINMSTASRTENTVESLVDMHKQKKSTKSALRSKVKFFDPSIIKAFDKNAAQSNNEAHHLESILAIATIAPRISLDVQKIPLKISTPSFESPPGLPVLEYVGYTIQKFKKFADGSFQLVEEIDISQRDINEYVDTRVSYGALYRYRIRSILRWTRDTSIDIDATDPTVIDVQSASKISLSMRSSYFGSEWEPSWVYASVLDMKPPSWPDELTIRPDSKRKQIVVTFRLPQDDQLDISSMKLFRKKVNAFGLDLEEWRELATFGPKNSLYVDKNVDYFDSVNGGYAYTAQTITLHGEYSAYSEQIAARLNRDYEATGEFEVDWISCAGVMPENFGSFSRIPMPDEHIETIARESIESGVAEVILSARESVGSSQATDSTYVVRFESLDTGEIAERHVTISFDNRQS